MDIKLLKRSTERIVAMLDIYQSISKKENHDSISLGTHKYKMDFLKEKLMLSVIENKKICEKMIKKLEKDIK